MAGPSACPRVTDGRAAGLGAVPAALGVEDEDPAAAAFRQADADPGQRGIEQRGAMEIRVDPDIEAVDRHPARAPGDNARLRSLAAGLAEAGELGVLVVDVELALL